MAYDLKKEYIKWIKNKEYEEQILRESGVNEEIIKCYIELAYEAMYSNDIQTAGDYFVTVLNMDNTCTKAYLGIAELEYQKDCYNTAMQWLNEGLDYVTDSDERKLIRVAFSSYNEDRLHNRSLNLQLRFRLFTLKTKKYGNIKNLQM
mgnify:CR=1 FL=1